MPDWETVSALVLAAFALPFMCLCSVLQRNIRKMRQMHTALEHLRRTCHVQEEQLRTDKAVFLEALGVPFLLLRRSGRLIMANSAAGDLLDGAGADCNTNLLWVLGESELHSMLSHAVNITAQTTFTIRHRSRSGAEKIFRVTATPLEHPEHPIGIVFHDITEEQRTLTVRRDFAANASHELRTPLTLIRGYIETLLENPESAADADERTHALRVMKKHADRVVQLVEDMLTISRLESGDRTLLKKETFSLGQLADDVLQRLEPLVSAHGAAVVQRYEPSPFELCGDRFYRADRTGRIKGTGLGLSIVRHAVEAHGGSIAAESELNRRTLFRITLPTD